MRDLQKVQRLCFRDFQSLMGSLVADLTHQVEGGGDIRRKHLAPLKNVDALHRVAERGQGDVVQGEHNPDHAFAQQASLHQAGLRIRTQIAFGQYAEFRQLRKFFVQKRKVGSHALSPKNGIVYLATQCAEPLCRKSFRLPMDSFSDAYGFVQYKKHCYYISYPTKRQNHAMPLVRFCPHQAGFSVPAVGLSLRAESCPISLDIHRRRPK